MTSPLLFKRLLECFQKKRTLRWLVSKSSVFGAELDGRWGQNPVLLDMSEEGAWELLLAPSWSPCRLCSQWPGMPRADKKMPTQLSVASSHSDSRLSAWERDGNRRWSLGPPLGVNKCLMLGFYKCTQGVLTGFLQIKKNQWKNMRKYHPSNVSASKYLCLLDFK